MILAQFPLRVAWPDLFIQNPGPHSELFQGFTGTVYPVGATQKMYGMATQERHSDALGRIMVRRLFAWYVYDIVCLVYLLISVIIFVNIRNRVWWMVHRLRPLASDIESSWSWWSVVYFRYPQSHFIWRHGSFHASMHHFFDTMCIFQKVHAMSCFIR